MVILKDISIRIANAVEQGKDAVFKCWDEMVGESLISTEEHLLKCVGKLNHLFGREQTFYTKKGWNLFHLAVINREYELLEIFLDPKMFIKDKIAKNMNSKLKNIKFKVNFNDYNNLLNQHSIIELLCEQNEETSPLRVSSITNILNRYVKSKRLDKNSIQQLKSAFYQCILNYEFSTALIFINKFSSHKNFRSLDFQTTLLNYLKNYHLRELYNFLDLKEYFNTNAIYEEYYSTQSELQLLSILQNLYEVTLQIKYSQRIIVTGNLFFTSVYFINLMIKTGFETKKFSHFYVDEITESGYSYYIINIIMNKNSLLSFWILCPPVRFRIITEELETILFNSNAIYMIAPGLVEEKKGIYRYYSEIRKFENTTIINYQFLEAEIEYERYLESGSIPAKLDQIEKQIDSLIRTYAHNFKKRNNDVYYNEQYIQYLDTNEKVNEIIDYIYEKSTLEDRSSISKQISKTYFDRNIQTVWNTKAHFILPIIDFENHIGNFFKIDNNESQEIINFLSSIGEINILKFSKEYSASWDLQQFVSKNPLAFISHFLRTIDIHPTPLSVFNNYVMKNISPSACGYFNSLLEFFQIAQTWNYLGKTICVAFEYTSFELAEIPGKFHLFNRSFGIHHSVKSLICILRSYMYRCCEFYGWKINLGTKYNFHILHNESIAKIGSSTHYQSENLISLLSLTCNSQILFKKICYLITLYLIEYYNDDLIDNEFLIVKSTQIWDPKISPTNNIKLNTNIIEELVEDPTSNDFKTAAPDIVGNFKDSNITIENIDYINFLEDSRYYLIRSCIFVSTDKVYLDETQYKTKKDLLMWKFHNHLKIFKILKKKSIGINYSKLYTHNAKSMTIYTYHSELGSLTDLVQKKTTLSWKNFLFIMQQIANSMKNLHSLFIQHRSLDLNAILINNSDYEICLTNFHYAIFSQYFSPKYVSKDINGFISILNSLYPLIEPDNSNILLCTKFKELKENIIDRENVIQFSTIAKNFNILQKICDNEDIDLELDIMQDLEWFYACGDKENILLFLSKNGTINRKLFVNIINNLAVIPDNLLFFSKMIKYVNSYDTIDTISDRIVQNSSICCVLYYLSNNFEIENLEFCDLELLYKCVTFEKYPFLKYILSIQSFNLDTVISYATPLVFAIMGRDAEFCEYFLMHGANPNYFDTNNYSPLDYALRTNETKVFEILIKYGANKISLRNLQDENFCIECLQSILNKHSNQPMSLELRIHFIRFFLQIGANINLLKSKLKIDSPIKLSEEVIKVGTFSDQQFIEIRNNSNSDLVVTLFTDTPISGFRYIINPKNFTVQKRSKSTIEIGIKKINTETVESIKILILIEITHDKADNSTSNQIYYDFLLVTFQDLEKLNPQLVTSTLTFSSSFNETTEFQSISLFSKFNESWKNSITFEENGKNLQKFYLFKGEDKPSFINPLGFACYQEDIETIQQILLTTTKSTLNNYMWSYLGWITVLHIACIKSNLNMIKLLITNGADANLIVHKYRKNNYNDNNMIPLFFVPQKQKDIIKYLIENSSFTQTKDVALQIIEIATKYAPTITNLSLPNCNLQTLPSSISVLENLKTLHLEGNPIAFLPPQISYCSALQNIYIDIPFSSLNNVSPDVTDCSSLLVYFKTLTKAEVTQAFLKLIIAGKENNGKTALVDRMCDRWHKRDTVKFHITGSGRRFSTTGIDISEWPPATKKFRDVTYSIWDFAGQKLYYITHSFFISDNAVYFLVFDMRDKDAQERLLYWLNTVSVRAPSARIYIIGTFSDKLTSAKIASISFEVESGIFQWKKRLSYTNINIIPCPTNNGTIVWPVSNTENKGIKILCENLLNYGKEQRFEIPDKYLLLMEELEKRKIEYKDEKKVPIIEYKAFVRLILCYGFQSNDVPIVIRNLSEWGKILYYPSKFETTLSEIVIIDPPWIVDLLRSVISHGKISNNIFESGILNKNEIEKKWKKMEVKKNFFPSLWSIFESFHICTKLYGNNHEEHYLIPSCVGSIKPKLLESKNYPDHFQLIRKYEIDFLPPGLFNTISVLFYDSLIEEYNAKEDTINTSELFEFWENGIAFHANVQVVIEMYNSRTEESIFKNTIEVWVKTEPKYQQRGIQLFTKVHFLIDNIFRDKYPSMHGFHFHPICCYISQNGVIEVSHRKNLASYYLNTKKNEYEGLNEKIPLNMLIPEILDPTSSFRSVKKYLLGNYNELELLENLARGNSGEVWSANLNGRKVALKIYHHDNVDNSLLDDFCAEISILCVIEHPNIVRLERFYTTPNLCIVLELMKGNLRSFLETKKEEKISVRNGARIAIELSRALSYLHSLNPPIYHNDIKLDNIMYTESILNEECDGPWVKLADFGYSKITSRRENTLSKEVEDYGRCMTFMFSMYVNFNNAELEDDLLTLLTSCNTEGINSIESAIVNLLSIHKKRIKKQK